MSEGDEKYKLGELTADMAAVKRDFVRHQKQDILRIATGMSLEND